MRILLDTHIMLWALMEPARLTPAARAMIEDPNNEVLFSAASVWEMSIKAALDRPDFRVSPATVVEAARDTGFTERPVSSAAALKVASLPPYHRDPFDRLLIAQAMTEPAMFYTADAQLSAYSELVVLL